MEMTQLPRETQKDGDTNKLKQYKQTKYKPIAKYKNTLGLEAELLG